jgi:hypothetical protein
MVLLAKRSHPRELYYNLFDLAGLQGLGPAGSHDMHDRKAKGDEVGRLLAEARTLVANAGHGVFPFDPHKKLVQRRLLSSDILIIDLIWQLLRKAVPTIFLFRKDIMRSEMTLKHS